MPTSTALPDYSARRAGIAVAVLLHVVLLAALLKLWPVHRALVTKAPMIMTFIVAPAAESPGEPPRPQPMTPTPKPRPVPSRTFERPPVTTVATDSRSAITLPAADSVKAADTESGPAAVASVASPAAVPAITPPSFNAAYLDNPAPPYPVIARRTGEEGRVLLRVLVSATGTAESVEVRTTSGSPRLDRAALETVRHWRFVPARQGDQAVAAWVLVPVSFTLST